MPIAAEHPACLQSGAPDRSTVTIGMAPRVSATLALAVPSLARLESSWVQVILRRGIRTERIQSPAGSRLRGDDLIRASLEALAELIADQPAVAKDLGERFRASVSPAWTGTTVRLDRQRAGE